MGENPITLQQLAGAADRLRRKKGGGHTSASLMHSVETLRDRIRAQGFSAETMTGFIREEDPKQRLLAKPSLNDRILQEALIPILEQRFGPVFSDSVHGYRQGRSTRTAAMAAMDALRSDHCFLLFSDIEDFFGSMDRAILAERLSARLEPALVEIIMELVSAPIQHKGETIRPEKGIPLGQPISPFLANLYLLSLDEAMQTEPIVYLRYADDLLVMARTFDIRERAGSLLEMVLADLKLRLSKEKTRLETYEGRPILYLGHYLTEKDFFEKARPKKRRNGSSDKVTEDDDDVDPIASERNQTVYITQGGVYLKAENKCIIALRKSEVLTEVPIHRVDRILVLTHASFSSGFVSECITQGIPVLFFVGKGRAYGSLISGGIPNPLRLRSQFDLHSDPRRRLALARQILLKKMEAFHRRLQSVQNPGSFQDQVNVSQRGIQEAGSISELIGFEGAATKAYYQGFSTRIKPKDFTFGKRSKRPPMDPINSLLSFSYSLLFGEMQTALLARGLDPHAGVLHELHRNHMALASDLIEPYRPLIADTFVLSLVNGGRVSGDGFVRQANGAVYMNDETRKKVLESYENFMSRPLDGAGKGVGKGPRALLIRASHAMLSLVLGETERLDLPLKEVENGDEAKDDSDVDDL